jgi:capsular exopolysaccharide synthesis family protein
VVESHLRPLTVRRPAGPVEGAAPPGLRRGLTPGTALAALVRNWPLALALSLVFGGAAAAAVWVLRPEKYTSSAIVRVSLAAPQVLQNQSSDPVRSSDGQIYLRTQAAMLKSRPIIGAALQDEKVRNLPILQRQADPVDWLDRELVVEHVPSTEVIRVSLSARGGQADLSTIVNAVIKAYMTDVFGKETEAQLKHLEDLSKVSAKAEEDLRQLHDDFQELSKKLNGGDAKIIALKQQTLIGEWTAVKSELSLNKSRVREDDLKIATYGSRLAPAGPAAGGFAQFAALCARPGAVNASLAALVEHELDSDPRVMRALDEVAKVQETLLQFEATSSNPNSVYRQDLQKKVQKAEAAVEAVRAERRHVLAARHLALSDSAVREQLQDAERERGLMLTHRVELEAEAARLKKELERLGANSVELETKREAIERNDRFVRSVWEQKERLKAELQGSKERKRVSATQADDAVVLNKMGRLQESAAGGLAGAALAVFGIAVVDMRRNRIHTLCDVSQGLQLRVLGALPAVSIGTGAAARVAGREGRAVLESVNGLRTALARTSGPGGSGQALMVASANPGEGKSTLATQLASSFARARRRTLLIDCDLRAPSLHRFFGLDHAPGVCEVLAGAVALDAAIRPSGIENLDLLSAGQFGPDAEAALAHRDLVQALIDAARARYAVVVIDSSPVLLVPDALMVGECVDGLLMAVRSGVSEAASVHAGYERFAEYHLPVLGVVVNGVPVANSYARGYGQPADPAAATL